MKYTTTILAGANLLALVQAVPVDGACQVITVTSSGVPVWKPQPDFTPSSVDPWTAWNTVEAEVSQPAESTPVVTITKSSSPIGTTVTLTKSIPHTVGSPSASPEVFMTNTVSPIGTTLTETVSIPHTVGSPTAGTVSPIGTTLTETESVPHTVGSPSASTVSTMSSSVSTSSNAVFTSSSTVATTSSIVFTTSSTVSTASSTASATSVASCPASNGASVLAGGSCDCSYTVNCASHASTDSATFWEQTSGALIDTLAECLAICDNNADCTATVWVDDATASASDYHRCWQTSGLGAVYEAGYGQISYKGACSGTCSQSYNS